MFLFVVYCVMLHGLCVSVCVCVIECLCVLCLRCLRFLYV